MMNISSYRAPRHIDEATALLSSGEFTPIAGGTDLLPSLRNSEKMNLLDIKYLGLDFIRFENDHVDIGAGASHTRLSESLEIFNTLPLLVRACGLVGSQQIRNRGTIGGNIINASPCADTVPALLNYDAEIKLISKSGARSVGIGEFIIEPYHTIRRPSELLYSIRCKIPEGRPGFSYIKLGRRQAVNISRMTVAVTISKNKNNMIVSAKVAAGSVFPTTRRIDEIENYLVGHEISTKLFEEAANLTAEIMIRESGVRWSTPYKRPVLVGLMQRALNEAAGRNADDQN